MVVIDDSAINLINSFSINIEMIVLSKKNTYYPDVLHPGLLNSKNHEI